MKKTSLVAIAGSLLALSLVGSAAGLASAGEKSAQRARGGEGDANLAMEFFATLDANQDGQVARAEAEAAARAFLDRMDGNADGEVTRQEVEQGAVAMREKELAARFKALDTNADGRLSIAESKLPARFFARLDKDADKALTPKELAAASKFGLGRGAQAFQHADTNRDGKVTREEGRQAALFRFNQVDENRDGLITRAELEARMQKQPKRQRQGSQRAGAKKK